MPEDSHDVLLFPTFSDGFGMVQVEAISRGLPVISTPNAASIIENEVSGFVVPVGSVDEVENCLRRYCEDRDLLKTHSKKAFERSADFTMESFVENVADKFGGANVE